MNWDTVERECFVLGVQLSKLGESFRALARELRRERESGRMALNEEAVTQSKEMSNGRGDPTPALPF